MLCIQDASRPTFRGDTMLVSHALHEECSVGGAEGATTTAGGGRQVEGGVECDDLLQHLTFLVDGDRVADDTII